MELFRSRRFLPLILLSGLAFVVGGASELPGLCGPFTDVAADAFCPLVLEIFYLGITTGTTPTTYDPTSNVTRLQMAAFLARTVDGILSRGSRRAASEQFWTPQNAQVLGLTTVGSSPKFVGCDGADIWVANNGSGSVSRVRASDGRLLETWTGAASAWSVRVAAGHVYVTGQSNPGNLYQIEPSQTAGAVTTVSSGLGGVPQGIAFDGSRVWTANFAGSVSIVTPGTTPPWTVTTVTAGFSKPMGALFDGTNIWVTDLVAGTLLKLDSNAAILQTVTVSGLWPVFDGANIWVPGGQQVSVVRAATGAVLATLTGNGLAAGYVAASDGGRVLITNTGGSSVSLWRSTDLTPLGSFPTGTNTGPVGACSDGLNFWIALTIPGQLARF